MTEPQRITMKQRLERSGTITLDDLRILAAPCSASDSFKNDPVFVLVGDQYLPVTDFCFVSGPYGSRVEIKTGQGMTRRELDKKRGSPFHPKPY